MGLNGRWMGRVQLRQPADVVRNRKNAVEIQGKEAGPDLLWVDPR